MKQILRAVALSLALIAGFAPAVAQQFPVVPDRTFIGRVGSGSGSGPSSAVPFSILSANLFPGTTTANCVTTQVFFQFPCIKLFSIPSDAFDASTPADALDGWQFNHSFGGSSLKGARQSVDVISNFTAATSASNTNRNYVPIIGQMNIFADDGGTGLGYGTTAKGSFFGGNFVVRGVGTNLSSATGVEVDLNLTGSQVVRSGFSAVSFPTTQGTLYDYAYGIGASSGAGAIGWKNGLYFTTDVNGGAPISTTGCMICTDGTAATVATGIDFSPYVISGYFLLGPGNMFSVDGAGTTIGLGGRAVVFTSGTTTTYNNIYDSAGNLAFIAGGGGASPDHTNYYENTKHTFGAIGLATTFAEMTTGATGIKFNQYGSGIIHSSAAGVLSSSAIVSADLNLTTTTCTNQFLTAISATATGTCTTDVLASAQHANQGTTTTVLHGNAAGNPSWGAVVSADLNITTTSCSTSVVTAISAGGVGTCTSSPSLTSLTTTGSITVGNGSASVGHIVNGSSSGTAGGANVGVQNGGTYVIAMANASNILGGAYDATPLLYSGGSTLKVYVSGVAMQWNASGTASTSSTTGTGVMTGGLGVSGAIWAGTYINATPTVVNSLPSCVAGIDGARAFVTNNNTATSFGGAVTTGGANHHPVYCDGAATAWKQG